MNIENPMSQAKIDKLGDLELADKLERERNVKKIINPEDLVRLNFDAFNERRIKDGNLSTIFKDIVEMVKNKDKAIDIGSGALRESKYLAEQGFREVIAVDYNDPENEGYFDDFNDEERRIVKHVQKAIEDYEFSQGDCNLIHATNVLSFVQKQDLPRVVENIKNALKEDGIFMGSFFGLKDYKVTNGRAIGYEEREITKLFKGFKFVGERKGFEGFVQKQGKSVFEQDFVIIAQKV